MRASFRILGVFLLAGPACLILGACASSRPLNPVNTSYRPTGFRAEQAREGIIALVRTIEMKERYQADVEIRNVTKKNLHGPESILLEDANGNALPALNADVLKDEIERKAEAKAKHSIIAGTWLQREHFVNEVQENARRDIEALEKNYLRVQDIPPNETLTCFVQFEKKGARPPLKFSMKVGSTPFDFQFFR